MITVQQMKWSNFFSYGSDNIINFDSEPLTQIKGFNGSGKSSIPLVLEELLYGKNSKGIKKQDLANRNISDNSLSATLTFTVNSDTYKVTLNRGSSLKLKLEKNGVDISSHTAPSTYKDISKILGMDFKTFSQLIYQSSTSSLSFLTDTDTNRKKFLISLFNLDKYTRYHEFFKKEQKEVNDSVQFIKGKMKSVETWLDTNSKYEHEEFKEVPEIPKYSIDSLREELVKTEFDWKNVEETNKRINQNNQYKAMLKKIYKEDLETVEAPNLSRKKEIEKELVILRNNITRKEKGIDNLTSLSAKCPTCYQEVNQEEKDNIIDKATQAISKYKDDISKLEEELKEIKRVEKLYNSYRETVDSFEKLSNLIDDNIPENTLDKKELQKKINKLKQSIREEEKRIEEIKREHSEILEHNTKLRIFKSEIESHRERLKELQDKAKEEETLFTNLDILKNAFGTNGLISYKLEFLVKDLENQINYYLNEVSSGKFQLSFSLKGDKLNINILNGEHTVTIDSLSAGELARVNISTLLAIRKIMSSISNTKINILFLDEILGVIDQEGKDKLVDILLNEKELNTFLVSHDFSHPLMREVSVTKEGKISSVQEAA